MIKHIVCFKLKDKSNMQKAKETLLSMKGNVPTAKPLEVGTAFLGSPRSYDVYLAVTVEDEQALKDYQADNYHCSVVKTYMHSVVETSVAVDFYMD